MSNEIGNCTLSQSPSHNVVNVQNAFLYSERLFSLRILILIYDQRTLKTVFLHLIKHKTTVTT